MMSQTASLFQYDQKWVFEEETLRIFRKFSEHFIYQFYFISFFFALRTKQNSSKDVSVTYFQKYANMRQMTSTLKT